MRLEFFEWTCGHHQACPSAVEGIASPDQALAILQAIGAAISQPGSARARLIDDDGRGFREYYIADDHAEALCSHGAWSDLPVVLVGKALVGDRRAAEALSWHLGLVDDQVDGWDGQSPLAAYSFATTSLSADAVRALPRDTQHPPLRVVEVTPELLAAALEDAIESEIIKPLRAQGVAA